MDANAQIAIEFVLLIGIILIVVIGISTYLGEDVELVQTMSSARSGAMEGASIDCMAIYPYDSFANNEEKHPRLISPSNLKIVNINYTNMGYNSTYQKIKMQLRITASCSSIKEQDKNSLGDRINFYARKKICESYGTINQTNSAYNPAYSYRYVFTTADVRWI